MPVRPQAPATAVVFLAALITSVTAQIVTSRDGGGDPNAGDPNAEDPNASGLTTPFAPPGTAVDCDSNGIPDACDLDCLGTNPVTGHLCLNDYPPDSPLPCGNAIDCNATGIPDQCEADCNSNGAADECDIGNGVSQDCNTNAIPDECEPDCDSNGVPDECDISGGTGADCNTNGVLDGCERWVDTPFLSADFDAGLPTGWTVDGLWQVTDACAQPLLCADGNWAYFGVTAGATACTFNTSETVSGVITAPAVAVPATANQVTVTYCSVYEGQAGTAPDGDDAAWLAVNGELLDDVSGTVITDGWETRTVDLQAYAGTDVTLSWHFDSNDPFFNNGLGWQIDAIELIVSNDCDSNGTIDACDLASGAALDCNSNRLPDTCELAGNDCNSNGVPDDCEPDADCNDNGITDICELEILYVDAAAAGLATGTSWADAFLTLGAGLTAADASCIASEVRVAGGTYYPPTTGDPRLATVTLRDGLRLRGGYAGQAGPNPDERDVERFPTVISGDPDGNGLPNNSYHVVTAEDVGSAAVLDGFTIRDGNADGVFPDNFGSALRLVNANPAISDCLFTANSAFSGTVACEGGAPTFDRCTLINNAATFGAGMFIDFASTPHIGATRFVGNVASIKGGALLIDGASPTLVNCLLTGNLAGDTGGGIHAQGSATLLRLVNCTLSHNVSVTDGGGLFCRSNATTIIRNSILWDNRDSGGPTEDAQLFVTGATTDVRYSCIEQLSAAFEGPGNTGLNPLLVDADGIDNIFGTLDDNARLDIESPVIDAGSNGAYLAVTSSATDLDGLARRRNDLTVPDTGVGTAPLIDLGAYEAQTDCNQNGTADTADIAAGTSIDCNQDLTPDECEIPTTTSAPGGPFYCLADCSPDCNSNGTPDACDILGGTSTDCSGDGVPDECDPDCNTNGLPDSCDLVNLVDVDCNNNNRLDSCELVDGDCDGNGVPDDCDLDGAVVAVTSGELAPVAGGLPLLYTLADAPAPVTDVELTVRASADLNSPSEYLDVELNGVLLGTLYTATSGFTECPVTPEVDRLVIDAGTYVSIVGVDPAEFGLVPSDGVDSFCTASSLELFVFYRAFNDCDLDNIPDVCQPDCNTNGINDACDVSAGTSNDCNLNGVPDGCDVVAGTSADANTDGLPDECAQDCDGNGIPDPCDLDCAALNPLTGNLCSIDFAGSNGCGTGADCDENGQLDVCAGDCNLNGQPDDCDIAGITSADCNSNNLPDECEIDAATPGGPFYCTANCTADCNTNGQIDSCESDQDADGVIDDCDICPTDPAKTTSTGICGCDVDDLADADADGVPDCIDLCPDTVAPPVDADGCALIGACCLGLNQCLNGLAAAFCELPPPMGIGGSYQGNGSTCVSDGDGDGVPNCDEVCPLDPAKTDPLVCGCGVPETDTDADGVPDCIDLCPATGAGESVDSNGCHEYGACCPPSGQCLEETFVNATWCAGIQGIYQGNGSTCALACGVRAKGDFDADGDVDLDDWAACTECQSQPGASAQFIPPSALCRLVFDWNDDGDVDLADVARLQAELASGP